MPIRIDQLAGRIDRLDALLLGVAGDLPISSQNAIERWRSDAAAMRFHLDDRGKSPPIVALLGGTGTGKSTMVNRLMSADLSAASFMRTYTAGPVAIVGEKNQIDSKWLGWPHAETHGLPARGQIDSLTLAVSSNDLAKKISLIDTPDLDGDQLLHHAQAERVFRWAQAIVFLVTPEKYQMTELLPFYRLARRYALPAVFVMNKCEEPGVLEDFSKQLASREWPDARVFVIPRDDAAYDPPREQNLDALRTAISETKIDLNVQKSGAEKRAMDLMERLADQIIAPQRKARRRAEELLAAVRSMQTPATGIDVNPITQQLQRRLQQRSVLYLMGPQRMLDRVRQVPALLVRLPRTAWDLAMRGEIPKSLPSNGNGHDESKVPDFREALIDQLAIVRSRLDDIVRADPLGAQWADEDSDSYKQAWIEPDRAGKIAEEELADLTAWLEKRWNSQPRDTRAVNALLKRLPGGETLSRWSEAAPYLLAVVVATHNVMFGHVDLLILGGWGLATWLTERISNEVASRTRTTNRKIADRFEALAAEQIERVGRWIDKRAMHPATIERIEKIAQEVMT